MRDKLETIFLVTVLLSMFSFSVSSLYHFGVSPVMGQMAVILMSIFVLMVSPMVVAIIEGS